MHLRLGDFFFGFTHAGIGDQLWFGFDGDRQKDETENEANHHHHENGYDQAGYGSGPLLFFENGMG